MKGRDGWTQTVADGRYEYWVHDATNGYYYGYRGRGGSWTAHSTITGKTKTLNFRKLAVLHVEGPPLAERPSKSFYSTTHLVVPGFEVEVVHPKKGGE